MLARTTKLPFQVIAVHSLKGGTGKSSTTAALVAELARRGFRVGLLDADVDSPFISEIIGAQGKITLTKDHKMIPVQWRGIPVMSFALWVPDAFQGASMSGQMHERWLADAINHTEWGPIDVLVADLSAGSGDEYLTVKRVAGNKFTGIVVVTLPHLSTTLARVFNTASYGRTPILGVLENMSGPVFGQGKTEEFCKKHGLKFLGSVPLDARIRERHERHEVELPKDIAGPIRLAADAVAISANLRQAVIR